MNCHLCQDKGFIEVSDCPDCEGTGRFEGHNCPSCEEGEKGPFLKDCHVCNSDDWVKQP